MPHEFNAAAHDMASWSSRVNFSGYVKSLEISEQKPPLPLLESTGNRIVPMKRPDRGTLAVRSLKLHANHFPVKFKSDSIIMHYNVDIKPHMPPAASRFTKKSIPKSQMCLIKDKLFSDDPTRFPEKMAAYDGGNNIFSIVPFPEGCTLVELFSGEDMKGRSCMFSLNLVNELNCSKIWDYLNGKLMYIPRDILQGMDVVMKENPCIRRISAGRSFFSKEYRAEDDLHHGIAAFRGFRQSLKLTSQGLALCLDYSALAFRKPLPVIDFLNEHVRGFKQVRDVIGLRKQVISALEGLKVILTHRITKQKYIIAGLTNRNTRDLTFAVDDPEGTDPPRKNSVVQYFKPKYKKEIMYTDIPCLDLGKRNSPNYVPIEFCTLAECQRYPKEHLDKEQGPKLKKISMPSPMERKNIICEMMRAEDGPCGDFVRNFGMEVEENMTPLLGCVIQPPVLKLGTRTGNKNGKSKPKHYHVLWDEHGFTSDQIQKHTYYLCFTSARCTKPVSLVPPVLYADRVAYMGRMFQEVMMELQPASSVSSSSYSGGASSSSSSAASLNERFCKLHPNVQDEMFFV